LQYYLNMCCASARSRICMKYLPPDVKQPTINESYLIPHEIKLFKIKCWRHWKWGVWYV